MVERTSTCMLQVRKEEQALQEGKEKTRGQREDKTAKSMPDRKGHESRERAGGERGGKREKELQEGKEKTRLQRS